MEINLSFRDFKQDILKFINPLFYIYQSVILNTFNAPTQNVHVSPHKTEPKLLLQVNSKILFFFVMKCHFLTTQIY